jgi:O-glycosyl hydrolase
MNKVYLTLDHLNKIILLTSLFLAVKSAIIAYPADYVLCLPGSGGDLATTRSSQLTITVDVQVQKQTIIGFGASDCWSAQYIGQWPSAKQNAIANLLFETGLDASNDPIGAGLSIWRMNVGAGSARQNNIDDPWRRSDFYYNSSLTAYDWTRCVGQRNFLQLAKARGVEHFKAFCNSPPITMTKNGNAFCDPSVGDTNLDPSKRSQFASYLADVLEYFRDIEGIDFKTISPFNEPEWDWNGGQEGCRYSNTEMSAFINVFYPELQSRGIDTHIDVCDSGQLDYLYSQGSFEGDHIYQFFNASSSNYIGDLLPASISSHSYWTDSDSYGLVTQRQALRNELNNYSLAYEQTEYCILGSYGPGRDLGIDPALYIARTIHYDMTIAQAKTWQWWLGISPYDYKDGLVYTDKNDSDGNYDDSKMLWAVGNFARFIRPGMKQIGLTRSDTSPPENNLEGLMVSSYYNTFNNAVVTVFVNRANQNKRVNLNYQNLLPAKPINYVVPYVTSSTDDLAAYAALNVGDTLEIPSKSIVTVVSMHITPGDLEPDGDVDIDDVVIMASQWLQAGSGLSADISVPADGTVNLRDFQVLSGNWLYGTTP